MKPISRFAIASTALLALTLLAGSGCSKNSSSQIDTSRVQQAFQNSGSDADKGEVHTAVSQIRAGDYSGGLASLQKAASNLKLTPEQKNAIDDLISQIKTKTTESVKTATSDLSKSASETLDKASQGVSKTAQTISDKLKK